MEKLFPTKLPHPGSLREQEGFYCYWQAPSSPLRELPLPHLKRDGFWQISLPSINLHIVITLSTLGSFVTEFCAKLSVSFDFLLQNSPGLSSFFPPALACLYFCLKLGCLPISTSIYVAFTPHETAPAGLRNYLATKPRASPPHLPLNTVQFSWTCGGAVCMNSFDKPHIKKLHSVEIQYV